MAVHRSGACTRLVRAVVSAALLIFVPITGGALMPAHAQERISIEFRSALEPYGRWQTHKRWGEVWTPARVTEDWRPYKLGRWAYTEDWGWYWVSDEDFGWVTYHYGRWVFDPDLGWVWIPGREWGPAFVQWRRGANHVGWAPLPPDDIIVEYRDEPDVWLFVRTRDFMAPRLWTVILPPRQVHVYVRETVVVNQTVVISDRGPRIAVNPGIEPAIIASAVRRPVTAFAVQPRVLAGTSGVEGAVTVRPDEMRAQRRERAALRESRFLRQTQNVIRPAERVPEARPLAANEKGRLGDSPPRAARAAATRESPSGTQPAQTQGPDREVERTQRRGARDTDRRAIEDAQKGRDSQRQPRTDGRSTEDLKPRDQRLGSDAQDRLQRDRRDAQDEKQRERRGAREPLQRDRRDVREDMQRERRDAREQLQRERQGAREQGERGRGAVQEPRREMREMQRGSRDLDTPRSLSRERPAATEGRSAPDAGRSFERGPVARPGGDGPRAAPMERGPRPDGIGRPAPQVERAAPPPRVEAPRGPSPVQSGPPATTGAAPREAGPPARGPGGPGGGGGGPPGRPGGPPGNN